MVRLIITNKLPKPLTGVKQAGRNIAKKTISGERKEAVSAAREAWGLRGVDETTRSLAKQRSDYIYNERRRAKRLVTRLEADKILQTGAEKKATQQYINYLQRQIEQTYAPRKGARVAQERQMRAVERLARETGSLAASKGLNLAERQQRIFLNQMNLANKGLASTLGKGDIGRARVKLFWRSTQAIWQGLPTSLRIQAVQEYYGNAALQDIWDAVMSANKEALQEIDMRFEPLETTSENAFYYEELDEGGAEAGSPGYLDFVVSAVYIAL